MAVVWVMRMGGVNKGLIVSCTHKNKRNNILYRPKNENMAFGRHILDSTGVRFSLPLVWHLWANPELCTSEPDSCVLLAIGPQRLQYRGGGGWCGKVSLGGIHITSLLLTLGPELLILTRVFDLVIGPTRHQYRGGQQRRSRIGYRRGG